MTWNLQQKNTLTNLFIYKIPRDQIALIILRSELFKKGQFCQQSSLQKKHDNIVKIYICSINIYKLKSKLKYGI